MGKPEGAVENYFVQRVNEMGGYVRKFVSPGVRGIPDRIAVLNGRTIFVEMKAPGETPAPIQYAEHELIEHAGGTVCVIDSKAGVDAFVDNAYSAVPINLNEDIDTALQNEPFVFATLADKQSFVKQIRDKIDMSTLKLKMQKAKDRYIKSCINACCKSLSK